MFEKRLKEINDRKLEIRALLEGDDEDVKLEEVKKELETLEAEVKEIEEKKSIASSINNEKVETRKINNPEEDKNMENLKSREQIVESQEYRNAFLKALQGKELTETEKRDYSSGAGSAGAVIPTQTANMIFDNMTKIAPMLSEIMLMRIPGNLRIAVQGTRNAAAAHTENQLVNPLAADTLATVTLSGFEFIKIVRISQTVQAMAVSAFEAWLTKIIAEDLAVAIDNEIINGGTVTGNVSAAQVWVNGTNQITYVPANGLAYADLTGLIALLPSAFDANAKFVMRKSTFYTQVIGMTDANGNPIAVQDIASPGRYSILGYPVLIDDNVAANEAFLGDFKQVVGNLSSDIRIDRSVESGFLNNSIDFRGTAIFDCDVAQPTAIVKLNV